MTQGDASFHHIQQHGQVIGLKLASSGSKFFFWLQSSKDDASKIVTGLNALLETGVYPILDSLPALPSKRESQMADTGKAGKLGEYAKQLATMLGARKADPKKILSTVNIMDACSSEEDLKFLRQFFPEGYSATNQDLRTLVTSPAFQQAVSLMDSIATPAFFDQFGLTEEAGNYPKGFTALLKAILKKHSKQGS